MVLVAEALYYQETGAGVFIKAVGHITASLSIDLRERIVQRLAQTPPPDELFADLSDCDYMDSTFMGLLVGFHKRFKILCGKSLSILRPSPECLKLLNGLGILKLMEVIQGAEPASPEEWQLITKSHNPTSEILLRAHQNLSELSPENERKFSALQNILKHKIETGEDD